jgi:hypothetical protein
MTALVPVAQTYLDSAFAACSEACEDQLRATHRHTEACEDQYGRVMDAVLRAQDAPEQGPAPRPEDWDLVAADARDRMTHLVRVTFDGNLADARGFLAQWEGEVTTAVGVERLANYLAALDDMVREAKADEDIAAVGAAMDGPRPASALDDELDTPRPSAGRRNARHLAPGSSRHTGLTMTARTVRTGRKLLTTGGYLWSIVAVEHDEDRVTFAVALPGRPVARLVNVPADRRLAVS